MPTATGRWIAAARLFQGCAAFVALGALIVLAGCTGRATMNVISLDYSMIDPQTPAPRPLDFDECYWWQADDAAMRIAMRKHLQIPFMGPAGSFTVQISLNLGAMPAGRERQYELAPGDAAGLVELGPAAARFQSIVGGVSVARDGEHRFRGNLRMETTRETQQVFGNWGRPSCSAWSGAFEAVEDREKGERIDKAVRARFDSNSIFRSESAGSERSDSE